MAVRVLMVVRDLHGTGGLELQARRLAGALAARGRARADFLTSSGIADLGREIPERGRARAFRLPLPHRLRARAPRLFARTAAALIAALGRGYDVLHGHELFEGGLAVALAARRVRTATIVKAALAGPGGDVARILGRSGGRADLAALGRVDRFVAVSAGVAADLAAAGVPERRIARIPNGVDVERFRPAGHAGERAAIRRELGLGEGPVLLALGRLDPQKRPLALVDALPAVLVAAPGARLVFLGDGPLREAIRERAERLGVAPAVELRGTVPDPAPWLRAADALAHASAAEGLSNAVLEAMASGLPVVAIGAAAGVADLLDGGRAGVVAPLEPAEAFAAALAALVADPPRRAALAAAARARAVERFSLAAVAGRYEDLYAEVLAERGRRRP